MQTEPVPGGNMGGRKTGMPAPPKPTLGISGAVAYAAGMSYGLRAGTSHVVRYCGNPYSSRAHVNVTSTWGK